MVSVNNLLCIFMQQLNDWWLTSHYSMTVHRHDWLYTVNYTKTHLFFIDTQYNGQYSTYLKWYVFRVITSKRGTNFDNIIWNKTDEKLYWPRNSTRAKSCHILAEIKNYTWIFIMVHFKSWWFSIQDATPCICAELCRDTKR